MLHVQLNTRGCCWARAGRRPRGSEFIGYYIRNGHEQHAATWSRAERQLVHAGERNGNTRTQTKGGAECVRCVGGGYGGGGSAVIITINGGEGRVEAGGGVFSDTALLHVHLQRTAPATPQEASRKSKGSTGIEQLVLSACSNKNRRAFWSHI